MICTPKKIPSPAPYTGMWTTKCICIFTASYLANCYSDRIMLLQFVRPMDVHDCQEEEKSPSFCQYLAYLILVKHVFTMGTTKRQ